MATHQNIGKLVPVVLEKDGESTNEFSIQRAVDYLLQKRLFFYIKLGCFHSFQVILKTFQHVVLNSFDLCVVILVQHVWNRLCKHRGIICLPDQLLKVSTLVLHLKRLPNLKRKNDFENLNVIRVIISEGSAFPEGFDKGNVTFSLFLKDRLNIVKASFSLSKRIHTMDIVAMKGLIKDDERNVGYWAQINKIFVGQRHPNFEEIFQNYN